MIYKLQNGRTIPLGGDYLEYLQSIPETYGGSIQPSVKVESLPKKFNGSQQAARTYAEGYQKGAKPVTKAVDNAGQKIFNTTKNIAMFVPGPTGAITWLGQMGADTANGEYSKVAKDLGAAILIGAGLKGAQVGAKAAGRALAGKGVNIPWLDAYDYSALRGQYFDNAANKVSKNFNKGVVKSYPVYHGGEFLGDVPLTSKGDEFGFHVTSDRNVAQSIVNSGKSGANKTIDPTKGVIREGQLTIIGEPLKTWDWGTWSSTSAQNLMSGPKGFGWNKRWLKRHGITYPKIDEFQFKFGEDKTLSSLDTPERNAMFAQFLKEHGVQAIEYPNVFEGAGENKSFAIIDPSSIKLAAHRIFIPKSTVNPQEAATTYHFDGRIPLSKQIDIAEKAGIPKGDRGLFNWDQIPDLIPRFNKWTQYYGYETVPESTSIQDAVNIMKNTFKRHNTFFRGVHNPDIPEDASRIEALFGKDYDLDDVYKYVATHGRPGDNVVFISPLSNARIYGSTGKTAIVRRRFKLGKNPETWLRDADFDIMFGGSPEAIKTAQEKNTFTFPWSKRGRGAVENELLAPDGTINFVNFVPQNASTSYFDLNGSLNKYLGYKSFHDVYGFGDYNRFTDVPIEKPKFKQGGKI